jgi:2-polyprenyl-6-methoxyphenol hydroxylase-like FAD-dependent oxidoreductase
VTPVQDVPDPEDPANWRFQIVTSWLGKQDESLDDAGRLAQVKQKASILCEPFQSAVAWMPDDTKITYDMMAYWVSIPWDNHDGRVTLAGDAAHPMTPRTLVLEVPNSTANLSRPRPRPESCNM